jgi:Asp-tRNA(Asn)/Glu-tRNA(Gln) amidotransferase A subunit family amidase
VPDAPDPRAADGRRWKECVLTFLSIDQTRQLLQGGDHQVRDQVSATLDAIAERDGGLRAFVAVAGEAALRDAEAADCWARRWRSRISSRPPTCRPAGAR